MTDDQAQNENPDIILDGEFLARFKDQLAGPDIYTDVQLNRVAFFMSAPALTVAGEIGAADSSRAAVMVTANLLASGVLADFVNKGCISISAIDRYMTELEVQYNAEAQKKSQNGVAH